MTTSSMALSFDTVLFACPAFQQIFHLPVAIICPLQVWLDLLVVSSDPGSLTFLSRGPRVGTRGEYRVGGGAHGMRVYDMCDCMWTMYLFMLRMPCVHLVMIPPSRRTLAGGLA